MLSAGTECGPLSLCSRISRELFKLAKRCPSPWEVCLRRDRHIRRRLLQIEPLEGRALMSADGFVSYVDPTWFTNYNTSGSLQHAGSAAWAIESSKIASSEDVAATDGQIDTYDWIVQFDTNELAGITSVAQVSSFLVGSGINFQVLSGLGLVGQVLVRSSGTAADAVSQWLDSNVNIAGFEQDSLRYLETVPNDPYVGQTYGMNKIHAPEAWNLTTGSRSVVVGVIDTGIDYNHSDLVANIWTNPGEISGNGIDDDRNGFIDDIHGYDFVNNDGDPMDDNSHGTHVSGTIAAVGNNSQGVAGVNWNTTLMALKFLSASGSGYVSDAVRAINYATMMKSQYGVNLRVLSNSWGGGGYSSSLATAIQASNNASILFVAAAGNSSSNNDATPQYPANYDYPNVISVAATDQNDQLASFSSYGATTVDLAAPGVSIYSTVPGNRYASYSGTSMATPHVSGVAALAWAYKPTATIAEIRNALLQGADDISTLSGKVTSGGRLNAYNTLQLLGGSVPSGPVLGSFNINPSNITPGTSVTLVAQGAASTKGVAAVYFYRDANGNGTFDSGDSLIGSDNTVVNGTAELSTTTTNLTTGSYRYFARALDNNNQWSSPQSSILTVVPPDDHGNYASVATSINVNTTTAGSIETGGDEDWFKFQAVAGRRYTIFTTLVGLRDSVLTLYGADGSTQLAYNDDYGSSLASYIQWTAPAAGIYYIKAQAYDPSQTGTYQLSLAGQNSAPVLQPIGNQVMSYTTDKITIPLSASDADGDRLTFSVSGYTVDPLAKKAYELDQQLGLYKWPNTYWTNFRGAREKYIYGTGGVAYFTLPNGKFYRWGTSISRSTLIYTFNSAYYNDPRLLHEARVPASTPLTNSRVAFNISGNQLTINPASTFRGDFYVNVSVSDGINSDAKSFKVTVTNTAQQRLNLTGLSSIAAPSSILETTPLSSSATTYVPSTSGSYFYANTANLYHSVRASYVITSAFESNYLRSSDGLNPDAVKKAFHDDRLHSAAWWSSRSDNIGSYFENSSHNSSTVLHRDINDEDNSRTIGGIARIDGALELEFLKDIEDTLISVKTKSLELQIHDELFATLDEN